MSSMDVGGGFVKFLKRPPNGTLCGPPSTTSALLRGGYTKLRSAEASGWNSAIWTMEFLCVPKDGLP